MCQEHINDTMRHLVQVSAWPQCRKEGPLVLQQLWQPVSRFGTEERGGEWAELGRGRVHMGKGPGGTIPYVLSQARQLTTGLLKSLPTK